MTTLIIKPTNACNARCRYCSAAHAHAGKVMSADVLRATLGFFAARAAHTGARQLGIIWHGGEPLLMPREFWEEVLACDAALRREHGVACEHRIQSNLTCLTPELVPVLKRLLGPRGTVGTSADMLPGVRELAGAPEGEYHRRWDRAVRLLAHEEIRYGILYVVHKESLPFLPEIYRFFRTHYPAAGLRFNPLYRQGRASESENWTSLGIAAEEWGDALATLFAAWTEDGRPENVQPFAPWWRLHTRGAFRPTCECSGKCVDTHFAVDGEGEVYLCGRSSDGGQLRYGNVASLALQELEGLPLRRRLANRAAYLRLTACRECAWWRFCHGGCINDALLAHGTPFAPTSWCEGLKRFFGTVFSGEDRACVA